MLRYLNFYYTIINLYLSNILANINITEIIMHAALKIMLQIKYDKIVLKYAKGAINDRTV